MKFSDPYKLYAVTDEGENLFARVRQALEGGVTCVQYRAKDGGSLEEALALCALCREFRVPFLVNDDVALAKASGADGVHVGQRDMSALQARKILGSEAIIGVSAGTLKQSLQAVADGADYLGVGAVFPTATKLDADTVNFNTLRAICTSVQIPVVAIGGISGERLPDLAQSGIAGVAVVSALFSAGDIKGAAQALLQAVNHTDFTAPQQNALILDFDGTLLDSLPIWETLATDFLLSRGKSPRADVNESLATQDLQTGIRWLKNEYSLEGTVEEETALLTQMLEERYAACPLKAGVHSLAQKIREHKMLSCIATSSDVAMVNRILRRERLSGAFGPVFSGALDGLDKTSPDYFLKILEFLGASRQHTTVMEDAPFALKSAQEAGLRTVAIRDSAWSGIPVSADVYLNLPGEYSGKESK